jgi:anti-anti-sigma factor
MDEPQQATVLALHGRLVEATVGSLEPMLAGLLISGQPRLVVDLSQIAVCDTAGVALLAGFARLARERGGELRLAAPSPAVCPWLRIGGTISEIATFTSVDGAMEADRLDLVGPAPCIDELRSWHSAFGVRRPQWRFRTSARARSRRGPASRRR